MVKRRQKDPQAYLKTIYILTGIVIVQSLLLLASCPRRSDTVFLKSELVKIEEPQERLRQKEKGRQEKIQSVPRQKEQAQEQKIIIPQETVNARIAIVLDDWGYSFNNVKFLREIEVPLTLAILPHRGYSEAIAKTALALHKETILHLPLEPHQEQKSHLEPDTIVTIMPKAQVLKILDSGIKSVLGIKGISNHMGSKATESKPLMKIIFTGLKRRKLYFLDSFTGRSVCKDLAKEMGISYARRQVFLDNKNEASYILGQVELLAKIAKQSGCAIGIGHDRQKTLEVLVKAIPELKKRGYRFVGVSELVKEQ